MVLRSDHSRESSRRRRIAKVPNSGRGPDHGVGYTSKGRERSTGVQAPFLILFTGVSGNYLRKSIVAAGLDPDNLPLPGPDAMNFQSATGAKAWRDIWGSGQGIGMIDKVTPAAELIARLVREYEAAKARVCS